MTIGGGAWRAHSRWWIPPLVFLLANVALLSGYRLVLAGQAQLRASRIERSQVEIARLGVERRSLEQEVERTRASHDSIDRFYGERLSSENLRLTRILAEVRELATRAGLAPTNINYGKEELDDHGLLRRSIDFNVEGSYLEFRRFVNMLELSDSFLTLERVGLRESDESGKNLRIAVGVSTLFTSPELADGAPARSDST